MLSRVGGLPLFFLAVIAITQVDQPVRVMSQHVTGWQVWRR
jgi:hypothetical protein